MAIHTLKQRIVVIIPTAHCRHWLPMAIESILNQSFYELDLYVIDDSSGDVDDHLVKKYPDVNFLQMAESCGPYVIDNMVLKLTQSEMVAFQDADDWSFPDRFKKQLKLMDLYKLDACGTWSVDVDNFGDPIGFEAFPYNASKAFGEGYYYPLRHPTSLSYRYVLKELGGFDNDARFGADAEYLYRAFFNYTFGNVQEFLYRNTIHPNSLTQNEETGFSSNKRKTYNEAIFREVNAIFSGDREPPKPGYLLNGKRAGSEEIPTFKVLQITKKNNTWLG